MNSYNTILDHISKTKIQNNYKDVSLIIKYKNSHATKNNIIIESYGEYNFETGGCRCCGSCLSYDNPNIEILKWKAFYFNEDLDIVAKSTEINGDFINFTYDVSSMYPNNRNNEHDTN